MNDLTENKSINKGKEYSQKLRKIILNEEIQSSKNKLHQEELNYKNFNIQMKNLIHTPNYGSNILNSDKNYSKISLPLIKTEKNNRDSEREKRIALSIGNYNEKNSKIKNNKYIIKNNAEKLFRNNISKYNKKHKKFIDSAEVNKIVNSLINSPEINLNEYFNSHAKEEKKKYPREKMIDPIYYIKYNTKFKSINKEKSKGFKQYVQDIGDDPESHKNNERLLNETKDINYGKIQVDKIYLSQDEINYKKIYEQTKKPKDFIFGIKDINCYKKIKSPQIDIIKNKQDKKKRNLMISKFKNILLDIYKDKNIKSTESYINNTINKFKSFDERMEVILNNTKLTENNINQKSIYHEKLIDKINNIYKCY